MGLYVFALAITPPMRGFFAKTEGTVDTPGNLFVGDAKFHGFSSVAPRPITINSLIINGAGVNGGDPSDAVIAIYQAPNGDGSGVANLIGQGSALLPIFPPTVNTLIPLDSEITIESGVFYVIMTHTGTGFIASGIVLHMAQLQTQEVAPNTHPLSFEVGFVGAFPATFDPDDASIIPNNGPVPSTWLI